MTMFASECSYCHDKQMRGILSQLSSSKVNSVGLRASRLPTRHACSFISCTVCGTHPRDGCAVRNNDNGFQVWEGTRPKEIEDASTSALLKDCKKCPGCSSPVWKDGGCHAITCKSSAGAASEVHSVNHSIGIVCATQFCWNCSKTYHRNGSIQHKEDCEQLQSGHPDVHDRTVTLEELLASCSTSSPPVCSIL